MKVNPSNKEPSLYYGLILVTGSFAILESLSVLLQIISQDPLHYYLTRVFGIVYEAVIWPFSTPKTMETPFGIIELGEPRWSDIIYLPRTTIGNILLIYIFLNLHRLKKPMPWLVVSLLITYFEYVHLIAGVAHMEDLYIYPYFTPEYTVFHYLITLFELAISMAFCSGCILVCYHHVQAYLPNLISTSAIATRKEFWIISLVCWILYGMACLLESTTAFDDEWDYHYVIACALIITYPMIAVECRRLIDLKMSRWNVLWRFVPIVNFWYVYKLGFVKGKTTDNKLKNENTTPSSAAPTF
ncbi:MAG: DUF805 domain-containing protein [Ketobacteraceae bacterium]|nr:DUF805 domain-containing protein [Ketobacteraceae bacterium]